MDIYKETNTAFRVSNIVFQDNAFDGRPKRIQFAAFIDDWPLIEEHDRNLVKYFSSCLLTELGRAVKEQESNWQNLFDRKENRIQIAGSTFGVLMEEINTARNAESNSVKIANAMEIAMEINVESFKY